MHILGFGNDIIEIARIRHLTEKFGERCVNFIFTPAEWQYAWSKQNPFPSLAVRFAAKEAISKAFGTGIGAQFKWLSAEIEIDASGAPHVKLDALGQKLLTQRAGTHIQIALSHCRTYALAHAIIWSE